MFFKESIAEEREHEELKNPQLKSVRELTTTIRDLTEKLNTLNNILKVATTTVRNFGPR